MTRLSLHHDDENPNLSIHLREGQYCTVGSSAAADYSFRAEGVEPVHCRIGCQASGGYIECFDVSDSITVNDKPKGRSRLANGDTLRIGSVELRVELPESQTKLANFAVEFETEETPTTKVVGALELERTTEQPDPEITEFEPVETSDDGPGQELMVQADQDTESSSATPIDENVETEPKVDAQEPDPEEEGPDEQPAQQSLPTAREVSPPSFDDESKPQFEFDSAEPEDVVMTHAEFDELSSPQTEEITMGSVDLESELVDKELAEIGAHRLFGQEPEEPATEEAGPAMRGGVFVGKYWRWNGEQAVTALKQLLDNPGANRIYRSSVNQITVDTFEEISLAELGQHQPAVFLLSSMDLTDLQQLIRKKRWTDRIGHPQAVTMFLTFLPKRMMSEFFEAIDACVLVNENDVELIRNRKTF